SAVQDVCGRSGAPDTLSVVSRTPTPVVLSSWPALFFSFLPFKFSLLLQELVFPAFDDCPNEIMKTERVAVLVVRPTQARAPVASAAGVFHGRSSCQTLSARYFPDSQTRRR
ncbi:hypothetical protein, partial [Allomesorhizobium camelthorni]|uniref:hypothetical protein n=1 Tax=Allomesorhizobium camelthorni TaxID=475069 RepID=UPI00198169F6